MGYTKHIIAIIFYAIIVSSVFQTLREESYSPTWFWIALIITFVVGYYLMKEIRKEIREKRRKKNGK